MEPTGAQSGRAERLLNTFVLGENMREAQQSQQSILRPFNWAFHPLNPFSSLASRSLADCVYHRFVIKSGQHKKCVDHLVARVMEQRFRTIDALNLAEDCCAKSETFFQWLSNYDPSMASSIMAILMNDMAMNAKDATEVLLLLNAFHQCLDRISKLASETAKTCVHNGTRTILENWREYNDKPSNIQDIESESIVSQDVVPSWSSSVKRAGWNVVNYIGQGAIVGAGVIMGNYVESKIDSTCAQIKEVAERPEKRAITSIASNVLAGCGKQVIYYISKGLIDVGSFYLYNLAIQQLLAADEEEAPSSVGTFTWMKTSTKVVACSLPLLYYGNALYQWKEQREKNAVLVHAIKKISQEIQPLDWIDETVNYVVDKLSSMNLADQGAIALFIAGCKTIIEEEFKDTASIKYIEGIA
jgi:hypothetical protein